MGRYSVHDEYMTPSEHGNVVLYDDAQRALDAAQELSAAWAEKARQYELELEGDPQNLHGKGRTFGLRSQLATLQAQLADRDAMILQMGEQAAVLAKENMAVKAQLRQVAGERDHAKKMEAVQKEVADNQTWHVQKLKGWRDTVTLALQRPGGARFEDVPGHIKALVKEHDTLRQLVEAILLADERGQGLPFKEAMDAAAKAINWNSLPPHPTEERHE